MFTFVEAVESSKGIQLKNKVSLGCFNFGLLGYTIPCAVGRLAPKGHMIIATRYSKDITSYTEIVT